MVAGDSVTGSWLTGVVGSERFHIDLGTAKVITGINYENYHNKGTSTTYGAKNFTFWGSNTEADFLDLVYANDGTWVQLTTDISLFAQHSALDAPDPKVVVVTNSTPYRYYAIKVVDNWGGSSYIGMRRLELTSTTPQDPATGNWFCTVVRRRYSFDPLNNPLSYRQVGTEDLNPYTIIVSKPGYETVSTVITVEEKTTIPITLKRAIDVMFSDRGPVIRVNRENYGIDRDVILYPP